MANTTINAAKEAMLSQQPLFLFDFHWATGETLSVSSHPVTYSGVTYQPRVMSQTIDQIQALSANGIEVPPAIKVQLADADKAMLAIERSRRFRGARVEVTFVFYDIATQTFTTDATVPFIGRCDRPEVADDLFTVTAGFILNPQAKNLPTFPMQQRCPKVFPATAAQKALADVKGSLYYACGVSDPIKTSCDYTAAGCAANNNSLRFGGAPWVVPPGSHSREYTTGNWLDLISDPCAAKYGDYAPIGFGTAWVDCLVLETYAEANSTRGEAIVSEGPVRNILKVTVNDEELPAATDVTGATAYHVADALFRYNVISSGDRTGRLNQDTPWNGKGDPAGSLCKIEWCVYHAVTTGTPRVRALVEFGDIPRYAALDHIANGVAMWANGRKNADCGPGRVRIFGNSNPALNQEFDVTTAAYGTGAAAGSITLGGTAASGTGGYVVFDGPSDDYAWAILAVLQRVGLAEDDTDLESFLDASEKFKRLVSYTVEYGATYASGVTYSAGDVVTFNGKNYVSLQSGNVGHEPDFQGNNGLPDTSQEWWAVCDASPAPQPSGTTSQHAMYTCSLVIRQRRSANDVLTGMLRGCNSHLGRNPATGKLTLFARGTIAEQQPAPIDGSNYDTAVAGGYAAYHFSESSMIRSGGKSTFRRLGRASTAVPNSVSISFANEDNDYSGDFARVVDNDDINLMGQEIPGNFPVDGCNSLDRANRIGSIYLAEQIDGEQYQWQTTHKAVKLVVGQIVLVSNRKYGFDRQPMRVQQIAPAENWKTCTIVATIHDDAWYSSDISQSASSSSSVSQRNSLVRPPRPWCPDLARPASGDPLYAVSEYNFGLQLTYANLQDGSPQPALVLSGAAPVTTPVSLRPPVIGAQGYTSPTGGTIQGDGRVYYVALASKDSSGMPGPLSGLCRIAVAQSGSSNTLTVPVAFLDSVGAGYVVYAGRTPARLTVQADTQHGVGLPSAITITDFSECGAGAPDTQCVDLLARARVVYHYGPFAQSLTGRSAGALVIQGAGWGVNQWLGYDCTILAKADGSPLPVLNFHVTSNTSDTLHVSPDPVAAGVAPGDLLAMLSLPFVNGFRVSDANWCNTLSGGGAGLAPGAEVGRVWHIVAGAGRGYRYTITSNDATSITVAGPWVVAPDATSRGVIEDATWLPGSIDSVLQPNSDPAAQISISVPVANYADTVLAVEVAARNGNQDESAAVLNPMRVIYVPGSQGTRWIAGSGDMLATDGTMLFDTSAIVGTTDTLAAAIADAVATTITLSSGTNTVSGTYLKIGAEVMRIVSGGGTSTLQVSRGEQGTTAAAHANGASVAVPGCLAVNMLPVAKIPNRVLVMRKTSADLNYVKLLASGSDRFPGGAMYIILPDNSSALGTLQLKAPGVAQ